MRTGFTELNNIAISAMMAAIVAALLSSACGSSSKSSDGSSRTEFKMIPELDGNNKAHGAAYTGDGMHFRKPIPTRPDWKPLEFYFKHCSDIGKKAHYSNSSYECSGPY